MHRIAPSLPRRPNNGIDVEIGRRADALKRHHRVRLAGMQRPGVVLRRNRHGGDAEFRRPPHDANGNLAPIGDQQLHPHLLLSAGNAPSGAMEGETPSLRRPIPTQAAERSFSHGPRDAPGGAMEGETPSLRRPIPTQRDAPGGAMEGGTPSLRRPIPTQAAERSFSHGPRDAPGGAMEGETPSLRRPIPTQAAERSFSHGPRDAPGGAMEGGTPSLQKAPK